jgi:dTMP kinase
MPFVSFEGIDGAGKTTQLRRIAQWLAEGGMQVVSTKEPDGGQIGTSVRAILASERVAPLSATEELLLVFAARYDHVRSVVRPALAAGAWVLSDRFYDSTYALQVHGTHTLASLFAAATDAVMGETVPDLTFIFDLEPDLAMNRRSGRGATMDDPAELTRDFKRIADGFRAVAAREPERCQLINAAMDQDAVFCEVRKSIEHSGLLKVRSGVSIAEQSQASGGRRLT